MPASAPSLSPNPCFTSPAAVARAPILVFDSGLGGLSVVAHLRAALPERALAYLCDNAALPYGTKADEWLVERIVSVCRAGVAASGANTLVVACNTASTLALEQLRASIALPIVGTVPAIKPAAEASRSRVIGLLATSATVRRPYTDALIERFAGSCRVIRVAADPLVLEAERLLAGAAPDAGAIAAALAPLFDTPELDTVVMGCTHFPLLRAWCETLAPRPIQWIDSGAAIARRTAQVAPPGEDRGDLDVSFATAPARAGLARALARFDFAAPSSITL
ncbi:glutamate racemase [Halotalea alkalilenta]|uniref:glutamate racemase n=1 Tax=Halotalea alkalilenta TaxID=376489 RepID=UPI0009DD341C|nr:glutamate racemase [Halotalea alkalilenta]